MERIVLGYDGSTAADSALDWVADRAARRGALVEVVLVTNMFLADHVRADDVLRDAESRLRTRLPSLPIETTRLDGLMPGTLTDAAEGADLLVIGIDRGHPVRNALRGWLPLRVSARASVPTCIVPDGWSATSGPVAVGLGTDDSCDTALTFAAVEAAAADEELRIVHSWLAPLATDGSSALAQVPGRVLAQHRVFLVDAADHLRAAHPDLFIETDLVRDNPVAALVAAAEESSLVVIGTHGRGVLAGGFLGSVAQDLVGAVGAPVCIVPPAR